MFKYITLCRKKNKMLYLPIRYLGGQCSVEFFYIGLKINREFPKCYN